MNEHVNKSEQVRSPGVEAGDVVRLQSEHLEGRPLAVLFPDNGTGFFIGAATSAEDETKFSGTGTFPIGWIEGIIARQRYNIDELALIYAQAISHLDEPEADFVQCLRTLIEGGEP